VNKLTKAKKFLEVQGLVHDYHRHWVQGRDVQHVVEKIFQTIEGTAGSEFHPAHKCPVCGCDKTAVRDKRNSEEYITRRRECSNCGKRYSTYELTMNEVKELRRIKLILANIKGL